MNVRRGMIANRWSDAECAAWVAKAGDDPADRALAERVYSSRIIGADPDLVMHGGGNTSIKVTRRDLFGDEFRVLHVKGSGWDLDALRAPGLPGVRLTPLDRLRDLDALSDEAMVNVQRSNLLDSTAPNPSVETLLHAWLPQTFVDHTHATPFLVLANLPDAEKIAREIFGDRLAVVPYIMPGFALAKAAAEAYAANPHVEGLLLLNHGHFTWGETARESYDKVVQHTNEVARHLSLYEPTSLGEQRPTDAVLLADLRGALGKAAGDDAPMPVLALRNGPEVMAFLDRPDVTDLATRGVASPDHVIRIKGWPLVLSQEDLAAGRVGIDAAIARYRDAYVAYFDRQSRRIAGKTMLAPLPQLAWVLGVGLVGIGATAAAASVAADLGEQNMRVRAVGEDAGGFCPIGEDDLFDMEYWSLEQAKLGRDKAPELAGHIVAVTGAAGAIGAATARAFAAKGASVLLLDRDLDGLERLHAELGGRHASVLLDVTNENAGKTLVAEALAAFGGLDILVSNAGAATSGALLDLEDETLRDAFELNFFAHHRLAVEAARLMIRQGQGGQILFNLSKQAINPGRDFGAYGLPKATTMFLMRQLALELGGEGIRVNGINADRIRSGLLTDDFIASRAKSRGLDEISYMAGNLLQREVEARHVAEGFVALALSKRTTAHVLTVDGGNIEAALR
ncbi:bifunctional aldolase/short-chain dehydrogenase [Thalassorhabdomicrobium marinisediminis]|uniref:Bifunctional aldolase/short-chain dehydrogenase n=1 Tax=Thalassorhabdomicrobium marinisediminis TaxID=2170577 RepID=A0A2T7FZ66_9RHOB|nr:bifunctional aldolase/short-chain dehydrogenase [Thalassorhabdomicrobium marinisediminis]PVA07463.1 bifunctional aldolase/short-chain dehydrogenase [Thalassorhabdomicrobium marinisediminis]